MYQIEYGVDKIIDGTQECPERVKKRVQTRFDALITQQQTDLLQPQPYVEHFF